MRTAKSPLRRAVELVIAVLLLHTLCVTPFEWETSSFLDAFLKISPDFLLILGTGLVLTTAFGFHWIIGHLMCGAILLARLYRVGWSVMPAFYGKDFDLYNDLLLVGGLHHLLTHDVPRGSLIGAYAGICVGLVVVWTVVYLLIRVVLKGPATGKTWHYAALASLQALFLGLWIAPGDSPLARQHMLSAGMYHDALDEAREIVNEGMWRYRQLWAGRVRGVQRKTQAVIDRHPDRFGALQGADVYLIFIESYGRILLTDPRGHRFPTQLRGFESELKAKGWVGGSGFVRPSVYGGGSSLAHAELLSGVQVEWKRVATLLLGSLIRPLPKQLAASQGYHTVNVQPATPSAWPESRSFFGVEEDVFQERVPYTGFTYHWGRMPDQFALDFVLNKVVRKAKRPLFLQYISVTSHAPFSYTPPFYDDWSQVSDPKSFEAPPARSDDITWGNYRRHPRTWAAYEGTISYSLRCAFGFARELTRPSLLIVLGDHQPPGLGPRKDPCFDVPVHILSNRLELIAPFATWNLEPGLVPSPNAKSFPLSEFLYRFMEAPSR